MDLAALSRTIDVVELGRRIKNARVAAGLTQTQLAGDTVTAAYVSRIEGGQRRPEFKLLATFADRLSVDLATLLVTGTAASDDSVKVRLDLDYAELHLATGNSDEALRLAQCALTGLSGASNPSLHRKIQLVRAAALEAKGDIDEAVALLEEATATPTPDMGWLVAVTALSRCHREAGEYSRAVEVGQRAVPVLSDLGLAGTTEAIQLSLTLAGAYLAQGDLTHAMSICKAALHDADQIDSSVGRGSAYWNASVILSKRAEHSAALDLARKALVAFESGDDFRNLARLRTQVGVLYLRLDPPDAEAAKAALSAAEPDLVSTSANVFDRAEHRTALARTHLLLGDHDTALRQADESLEMLGSTSPELSAAARVLQGRAHMACLDVDAARESYRMAAAELSRIAADRHIAEAWFDLAGLLEEAGLTELALDAYRRGATATGLKPPVKDARGPARISG